MSEQPYPSWVLRPQVPDEVYTDRQEFLNYFYEAALHAIERRTMSTVLLGTRRMGKTEIFKRVVNRLFFEQDHTDPKAAVPVYFSFPDEIISREDFALKYVENFVRWYAAFRLRDPQLLEEPEYPQMLREYLEQHLPISRGFKFALGLLKALEQGGLNLPEERALHIPRTVSDWDDTTIIMFLDEFQNTHLPEYQFRVVGFMQEAVESNTCPHFVTGSAMSILSREIIGRGSLFGRFDSELIEPMTSYWGGELALRSARHYHAVISDEMASVVATLCGGNPFYITAVIRQAAKQEKFLRREEVLNEILAVDLSSGFIWGELNDQVNRWIKRINEHGITKWILYLSALEEGDRLDVERIQRELRAREGKDVSLDTIRDVLIKLSRGDLLQYMELGGWFRKVDDPILLEFLKVWGRIEVEGQSRSAVQNTLVTQYQSRQRKFHEYKGYLGEVFMAQVLWNSQRLTLPGRLFHSSEDIEIPWRFVFIHHRMRLQSGKGREIDLIAAAGGYIWVCQSKWWATQSAGIEELRALEAQGELVHQDKEMEVIKLTLWLFSYSGLREDAREYAREHGILWSGKAEMNELLQSVGLRSLPEFES